MENKDYISVIESINIIIGNMEENLNDLKSSLKNGKLGILPNGKFGICGVDKAIVESEIENLKSEIALHKEAIEDLKKIDIK